MKLTKGNKPTVENGTAIFQFESYPETFMKVLEMKLTFSPNRDALIVSTLGKRYHRFDFKYRMHDYGNLANDGSLMTEACTPILYSNIVHSASDDKIYIVGKTTYLQQNMYNSISTHYITFTFSLPGGLLTSGEIELEPFNFTNLDCLSVTKEIL